MTLSPTRRVTRSVKAKETLKRAKRKATPADSGYGGSDESRHPSYQDDAEALDRSRSLAVHRQGSRARAPRIQDLSPRKRTSRLGEPTTGANISTTRNPSSSQSPSKKRRIVIAPSYEGNDILLSPVDLQLQSEMLAGVPNSQVHRSHVDSQLSEEAIIFVQINRIREYFEDPDSHINQNAIEKFFAFLPELPKSDAGYRIRYASIQDSAWDWAEAFFKEDAPLSPPLDLMHLARTSPELMEYINSTASSPYSESWEHFLHLNRVEIVHSIIGKALEMHMFGKELFGTTRQEEKELQLQDYRMRDSDGNSPSP